MREDYLIAIRVMTIIILALTAIAVGIWFYEQKPISPWEYIPRDITINDVKSAEIPEFNLVNPIDKNDEWELWTCTAYTSLDPGCNNYSAIELDIYKFDKYFDFCAIDPAYYSYGDIFQIRLNDEVREILNIKEETKEALAADCGSKIKGEKRMDLYFGNNLIAANKFGVRELEVRKVNG